MSEEESGIKITGFKIFRENLVKRLTPTHFLVKTEEGVGSFLVELGEGKWNCDCGQDQDCCHRFAAQLSSAVIRPLPNDQEERELKCRYCGSPDLSRCGFRYNAYGISHRYRCNECLRKFSVKYSENQNPMKVPSEMTWLLAEIGMVLSKVENLVERISEVSLAEASGVHQPISTIPSNDISPS